MAYTPHSLFDRNIYHLQQHHAPHGGVFNIRMRHPLSGGSEILEISDLVFKILNNDNLKWFFSEKSNSEVNIVGEVDGNIVSGRIDRMVELDDKILILDYKNTLKNYKNSAELPKEYLKQLELYKKLLEKTNKNKLIECYILITSYGNLIKIE